MLGHRVEGGAEVELARRPRHDVLAEDIHEMTVVLSDGRPAELLVGGRALADVQVRAGTGCSLTGGLAGEEGKGPSLRRRSRGGSRRVMTPGPPPPSLA